MDSLSPAETAKPIAAYLPRIEALVRQVIELGRFQLKFEIRPAPPGEEGFESPEVVVDFSGPDSDLLVEAHAELLNALEYLVLKAVRREEDLFGKIAFDCQGWRQERIEELRLMAQVAADRVVESGSPFRLGPMNPRERRIVHLALRGRSAVRTASEGFGTERKVVILPADEASGAPVASPSPHPS
jgi:spoIIIJ-associated protein